MTGYKRLAQRFAYQLAEIVRGTSGMDTDEIKALVHGEIRRLLKADTESRLINRNV